MLELPHGVWRWIADNAKDLSRMATSLEKMAEDVARIRAAMEDDKKETKR